MRVAAIFGIVLALSSLVRAQMPAPANQPQKTDFKFAFGPGQPNPGWIAVPADAMYSADRGYGFEPNTTIPGPGIAPVPAVAPSIEGLVRNFLDANVSLVASSNAFLFSVAVPEGNYRVTVTLGDFTQPSTTTVKSESRMLQLESIHNNLHQLVTRNFTVNIHTPTLAGATIKLDSREIGVFHWDNKLTLEFMGDHPSLDSLEIHKIDDAVTVFLCGDSTVTSQVREPYDTWGQMLPRWFNDHVAIADYAESGETVKAFRAEHRWDKVMSEMKPGDYVFMQFGTNDLNKNGHNGIWPADDHDGDWANTYVEANTDYKRLLEDYAKEVKAKGGIPVIVSPMTKIQMTTGAVSVTGLGDYPKAAVAAAAEAGVACIDLNAMSIAIVNGLGPDQAKAAYVEGLHSKAFGGYLFSRAIVEGIKQNRLDLAKDLVDDAGTFDPAHPTPALADFKIPLEPGPPPRAGGRGPRGRGAPTSAPATTPASGLNRAN